MYDSGMRGRVRDMDMLYLVYVAYRVVNDYRSRVGFWQDCGLPLKLLCMYKYIDPAISSPILQGSSTVSRKALDSKPYSDH